MELAIENLRSDGIERFYFSQAIPSATGGAEYHAKFWRQRDMQGASNLRWLIESQYAGRKIIFWAHNAHVAKAYFSPGFKDMYLAPRPDSMKPAGMYLSERLGDKVYAIAMASYEGSEASMDNKVTTIPPTPSRSLEARLHGLGKPYLFLNLRALKTNAGHALHDAQTMRVLVPSLLTFGGSGNYTVPDLTQVFDGILYIDRLTPATLLGNGAGSSH